MASLKKTKLFHDMELNILKHQILDLQSSNDDKAIIARYLQKVHKLYP